MINAAMVLAIPETKRGVSRAVNCQDSVTNTGNVPKEKYELKHKKEGLVPPNCHTLMSNCIDQNLNVLNAPSCA